MKFTEINNSEAEGRVGEDQILDSSSSNNMDSQIEEENSEGGEENSEEEDENGEEGNANIDRNSRYPLRERRQRIVEGAIPWDAIQLDSISV